MKKSKKNQTNKSSVKNTVTANKGFNKKIMPDKTTENIIKKETPTLKKTDDQKSQSNNQKVIKADKGFLSSFWNNIVGEKKELRKYWKAVEKVESFNSEIEKLSDNELKEKTFEFRKKLSNLKGEALEKKTEEIMPEVFAVVREASMRTLKMKHFPVQLIGGMVLNEGRVAEMKTGEGKTLVATLTVYLNALAPKNQVHVVTVNDYLARRDASWMGRIYNFLGLSVGVIQNQSSFYFKLGEGTTERDKKRREAGIVETYEDGEKENANTVLDVDDLVTCSRKRAYWDDKKDEAVDIVYGVNSEFGFDYLRDNMAKSPEEVTQKAGHTVAVIDEVDSILIDEARTPLIISSQDSNASDRYEQFSKVVEKLNPIVDYEVDEKRKIVNLSELGIEKVERLINVKELYGTEENVVLIHHLDQALRAKALFKKEKEYVIKDGEIVIVDENTGRMMVGRRFNQGLHQAIEAKEGQKIKAESKTVASITFQNFFRLYDKLAGMTGTAATESEELFKIYGLLVVSIPTNKQIVRKDFVDYIFKTEKGKFTALVRDIAEINKTGQPILVGTTSIEKNTLLSQMLTKAGVKHEVLNAKNHEQEARIISAAGRRNNVTIATNIAGRGVDIKLGGEKPKDKDKIAQWQEEHDYIKDLGGLFVIGTERHESRRIDNQLRGRSGRQGDPGASRFYVSLQDYILRVFGGDKVGYYNILPIPEDQPIQNKLLAKLIEEAQKKIEGQQYDVRKHVTDYDDVINRQRSVIYERRRKVLMNEGFDWNREVVKSMYNEVENCLLSIKKIDKKSNRGKEQLKRASSKLKAIAPLSDFDSGVLKIFLQDNKWKTDKVTKILTDKLENKLKSNWEIYEKSIQTGLSRYVYLRAIDLLWTEHLVTIDQLNDSVRLRGYSQKDPLTEFKDDGMKLFTSLLSEIDKEVSDTIFKVNPELVPPGILKS